MKTRLNALPAAWSSCQFIDIHYHASPDLYIRRHNAIAAGEQYKALNGVVVLKSHLGATSVQATLAQASHLPVLPSLVLNSVAGGVHYQVVLRALAEYQSDIAMKMIVHLPTLTGRRYHSKLPRKLAYPGGAAHTTMPETVFDSQEKLKKEVIDILKMASDYPIVLSTGHASKQEVYALIEACAQYNVPSLLLNQPANPLTDLNADELAVIGQNDFVWIEQTALTLLLKHQSIEDFQAVVTHVPRVIYSSDLGQTSQMDIAQWLTLSDRLFGEFNLPPKRQEEIKLYHPYHLLSMG